MWRDPDHSCKALTEAYIYYILNKRKVINFGITSRANNSCKHSCTLSIQRAFPFYTLSRPKCFVESKCPSIGRRLELEQVSRLCTARVFRQGFHNPMTSCWIRKG